MDIPAEIRTLLEELQGRIAWLEGRVNTYAKVGFAKLYDRKSPLTAADLLNDRVIPFYEEQGIPPQRVLTDRGREYCGTHDRHKYELYLAVEDIDHTRTKAKSPQTHGIVERFHKTHVMLTRYKGQLKLKEWAFAIAK